MTKNYEELFQDRVDELLLLEQRADVRKNLLRSRTTIKKKIKRHLTIYSVKLAVLT